MVVVLGKEVLLVMSVRITDPHLTIKGTGGRRRPEGVVYSIGILNIKCKFSVVLIKRKKRVIIHKTKFIEKKIPFVVSLI